jgi:hypothetical protein
MALPNEIVGDKLIECMDCHTKMKFSVQSSAAGFYIGTMCSKCGPYSRESGYFASKELAQNALDTNSWKRRNSNFNR